MAAWIKNKIVGLLGSLGWTCDSIEGSLTSLEITGLKSSETYRGCSCNSIKFSFGLRQGVRLDASGIRLNFLLSKGEVALVAPAKDDFGKARPKQTTTFFKTFFMRMAESLSLRLLKASSFIIRDFELRLESAQSGRSFASIVSFEELSGAPMNNAKGDVAMDYNLIDFGIRWDTSPTKFVYLGQQPESQEYAAMVLAPVTIATTLEFTEQMSVIRCTANLKEQIVVSLSPDEISDMLSLANGGGVPNAWGLDRSPMALWKRGYDTIIARRKFVRDKKVHARLSRLHAARLSFDSFEEFFEHAQRVFRGETASSSAESSSPLKVAAGKPRRFLIVIHHEGLGKITLKGDKPAEITFANPAPIVAETSSDGAMALGFSDMRIGLPAKTVLILSQFRVSSMLHGQQRLNLGGMELTEEGVTLLRLSKCELVADVKTATSLEVRDIIFKDEWPRFWNAYLGYKYLLDFFLRPMRDSSIEDSGNESNSNSMNAVVVRVTSILLLSEELVPDLDKRKGFGMQSIALDVNKSLSTATVGHFGMFSPSFSSQDSHAAIQVHIKREDGNDDDPWNITIHCKRVPFALNMPLILFWTKIKGPPPAHPPVTAPILSLLPLTAADHSFALELEECTLAIGDDIFSEVTCQISSTKARTFYDAEGGSGSDEGKSSSGGSNRRLPLSRKSSEGISFRSGSSVASDGVLNGENEDGLPFVDTMDNIFEATHSVTVELRSMSVRVLKTKLVTLPHLKIAIREGAVGGTSVQITSERRPRYEIDDMAPVNYLLDLGAKLFPYNVPQPKIPLKFKYFPDVHVTLAGAEVVLGPRLARWIWAGMTLRIDARGGGNYLALHQICAEVRGFLFDWNMRGGGIMDSRMRDVADDWVTVATFPPGSDDPLVNSQIDFHVTEKQDVRITLSGGSFTAPFPVLKSMMETREALLKALEEASLARHTKEDLEIESEHEVQVVMMMEEHNVEQVTDENREMATIEYERGSVSLLQMMMQQMFVQVQLESDLQIKLLNDIEFCIVASDTYVSTVFDELALARRSELNVRYFLNVYEAPTLHSVRAKISLTDQFQHPERRGDRVLEAIFYESIRLDFDRRSVVQFHRLLKLLEAKTTKKDDLTVTAEDAVADQTLPRLAPIEPFPARRLFARLEVELPGMAVTFLRTCAKTNRQQKVAGLVLDAVRITGLQKRLESRLEVACSLSLDCLDGMQILDPARMVIVIRGFGTRHEKVLSSISLPQLDVDVRGIDPFNFNVSTEAVEGLTLCQQILGSVQEEENAAENVVVYKEHEGGYYIMNEAVGIDVFGCIVNRDDVLWRAVHDEMEVFHCGGWMKKCDPSGLNWSQRFFRMSPLLMTYSVGEHSAPVGAVSLLDPFTSEFLTVTMDGDSDDEWRLIDGASILVRGVGIETVASLLPSNPGRRRNKRNPPEAKSVRSFQLCGRDEHDHRRVGRKLRFIARDTRTKLRFLRFLDHAKRSAEAESETLRSFKRFSIKAEKVLVEGAGACIGGTSNVKTPDHLTCFVELDGSGLTFFDRAVPRHGEKPSSAFDRLGSTSRSDESASLMLAAENQRNRHFLGCLDLFFALAVFRENADHANSFYIEFSPSRASPNRIRLSFDSREQCRKWEGNVAETIAVCFQLRQQFQNNPSSAKKGYVFAGNESHSAPRPFKIGFQLRPGDVFHVEDPNRVVIMGTTRPGPAKADVFIPDLVASPLHRLVRAASEIALASPHRERGPLMPQPLLREGEQVFKVQNRGVLRNGTQSRVRCTIELVKVDQIFPVASSSVPVNPSYFYYGVENTSGEVIVVSWRLIDCAQMEETPTEPSILTSSSAPLLVPHVHQSIQPLDIRTEQTLLPGETRWYRMASLQADVVTAPDLIPFRANANASMPPLAGLRFAGWTTLGRTNPHRFEFVLDMDGEGCIPPQLFPLDDSKDFVPILRLPTKGCEGTDDLSEHDEIIFLSYFCRSNDDDDKRVVHGVMVASEVPRFVINMTRFTRSGRAFLVLEDLIRIENQLPKTLFLVREGMERNLQVDANGGTLQCFELLFNVPMPNDTSKAIASLVPSPFASVLSGLDFALDISGRKMRAISSGAFVLDEGADVPFRGRKRIGFPNGFSAYVVVESGFASSVQEDEEDVEETGDQPNNEGDAEAYSRHGNHDDDGANGDDADDEDDWVSHFHWRKLAELPLRVRVEAKTRLVNRSGLDLFLRPKNASVDLQSTNLLLLSGQTGFLCEEGISLELATVSMDLTPMRWSSDAFLCRIGVSGAVEAGGRNVSQVHKFAVEVAALAESEASGCVVTISSFYTVKNLLPVPLELLQLRTQDPLVLMPDTTADEVVAFHPLDVDGNGVVDDSELIVQVRKQFEDNRRSRWSAPFRMDIVQELLLICDTLEDVSSSGTRRSTTVSSLSKCDATNSAFVPADEISDDVISTEEQRETSEIVFALTTVLNGPALELSFVPADQAHSAVRYHLVNASRSGDIMAVLEVFSKVPGESPNDEDMESPVVVHSGKSVPYVFRHQTQTLVVSLLRYRERQPLQVDMSNVGWSYRFEEESESAAPTGLVLEVTESEIGRCLLLAETGLFEQPDES